MNILAGVFPADSGEVEFNEKKIRKMTIQQSEKLGIAFVHQELNLFNDLKVYENIFLMKEYKKKTGALDAAELQLIIARLDSTQDEKIRGDLDRDLHLKIAQISANPLILSVLNASAQITENMIVGIRSYLMQKNNDAPEIDSQHTRLVQAITNNDAPLAEKVMNEHMHTIEYLLNEITSDNLTISDNVQQP